jgi:hypothetical protein
MQKNSVFKPYFSVLFCYSFVQQNFNLLYILIIFLFLVSAKNITIPLH